MFHTLDRCCGWTQTRYTVKYRHTDGKVVLKVTDDTTCLKFKTDQAQDVKVRDRPGR